MSQLLRTLRIYTKSNPKLGASHLSGLDVGVKLRRIGASPSIYTYGCCQVKMHLDIVHAFIEYMSPCTIPK